MEDNIKMYLGKLGEGVDWIRLFRMESSGEVL
jgi:hypothetical protein